MVAEPNDASLWDQFHRQTLPAAAWTHRAHLRVSWMFLERYELDEAHLRMRVGIIRLNHAHALDESAERGYFETLTRAWLVLVAAARTVESATDSEAFLVRHPGLLDRQSLLAFYSRGRILSVAARARWLEPDLAPLPVVAAR